MGGTTGTDSTRALVERLYPALAGGDRDGVAALLAPDFEAWFSPGLPEPIGGRHAGPADCIDRGWWAIGARWAVRAEPDRWLPSGDTDLVVLGDYTGRARRGGPLTAPFAHAWSAEGGRLRSLRQYTDTALWIASLESP